MGSNERFMDERTSNAGFSMKSLVIFMLRDHWRRLHTPCHPRTFSLLPSSWRRRSALRGRLPIFPHSLSVQLRAHTLADAPRRGREPFGPDRKTPPLPPRPPTYPTSSLPLHIH